MMKIHRVQVDAFSQAAVDDFILRMRKHLRETYQTPTAAIPDQDIDATTRDALRRAGSYGLESEYEVCRFTELLLEFGPAFDERLDVREALGESYPDIDVKFDAVRTLLIETTFRKLHSDDTLQQKLQAKRYEA